MTLRLIAIGRRAVSRIAYEVMYSFMYYAIANSVACIPNDYTEFHVRIPPNGAQLWKHFFQLGI